MFQTTNQLLLALPHILRTSCVTHGAILCRTAPWTSKVPPSRSSPGGERLRENDTWATRRAAGELLKPCSHGYESNSVIQDGAPQL